MMRTTTVVLLTLMTLAGPSCRRDPEQVKRRLVAAGDELVARGEHEEAIAQYERALTVDPAYAHAALKIAETHETAGVLQAAAAAYAQAADLAPKDLAIQIKAGTALARAGRYEDAARRARRVLGVEPDHVDALVLLANATAGLDNLNDAIIKLEEAIRLSPPRGEMYANLGSLQLASGFRGDAEAAFKRAVALSPKSVDAHLALANFYWALGDLDNAERELRIACDLEPQSVLANRAAAVLYLGSGRPSQAERYVHTIADLTSRPSDRLTLAEYYLRTRRVDEAIPILRALRDEPEVAVAANLALAATDFEAGRRDEAYEAVDAILAKDSSNSSALLLRAQFLIADGRLADAAVWVERAAAAHPSSADTLFALGTINQAQDRPAEAAKAFAGVLALNPRAGAARRELEQLGAGPPGAKSDSPPQPERATTAPGGGRP